MPRRGASDAPLTIGVWGYGEASQESVEEVLGDLTERQDGNIRFLFLVTSDSLSDSLQHAIDFAIDPDILTEDDETLTLDFEVVTDAESKADRPVKEILHAAVKSSIVQDPEKRFLDLLETAPRGHFAVLLDEEDQATVNMVIDAMNRGLDVFDLTQQYMHLLPPEDDEGGADRDSEEEVHVDDGISEALGETAEDEEDITDPETETETVSTNTLEKDVEKALKLLSNVEQNVRDARAHLAGVASNGHAPTTETVAERPRKKRGRPAKTETVARKATPANGEAPRRRGRPPMPRDKDGNIIRAKATV